MHDERPMLSLLLSVPVDTSSPLQPSCPDQYREGPNYGKPHQTQNIQSRPKYINSRDFVYLGLHREVIAAV